ncbi:MAG: ATP-dependent DNA helicase RecG [Bacteroidota bacterium]
MNARPIHATDPLAQPIQFLKGIGPRKSAALAKLGILTVRDLLFYVPRRYLDRTTITTVAQLRADSVKLPDETPPSGADVRKDVTVIGEVKSFRLVGGGRRSRFVLILADATGSMQCVWFGGVQYWKSAFAIGQILAVSGQPTFFGGVLQFVHPAIDRLRGPSHDADEDVEVAPVDWSAALNTGGLVPLYPSGQDLERIGLDSAGFRRAIASALKAAGDSISESLPASIIESHHLLPLDLAIRSVHFPKDQDELDASIRRLKYEELFFFQIKLALKRRAMQEESGLSFKVESKLARQLVDALPFKLTKAQVRAVNEITADMKASRPLNRLLQGDVGSGKTIVALICLLIAVDNGYQGVFMAPTEILAEQHFRTLSGLLKDIPINVRLMIGGQKTRLRKDILEDIRRGSANIVVGTHALFEKKVEFGNLGFVVIDEQHRFGVMQRAELRQKGANPDVLVMTATPIPRTLSLTVFGDLDVSVIDELPRERKPIKTLLRSDVEKEQVFEFVRGQIREERQAYFVYPLIEESEKLDLKAATEHYEHLRKHVFADLRVGLIHGRLESGEKDAIMLAFKARELDILVATTVIEVGIDVPNASVMVIENAERFGLAQLHQLRGRVGRGAEQSYCILMAPKWLVGRSERVAVSDPATLRALDPKDLAAVRLATIAGSTDGFRIAEVDLQIRGPGDFFGTRQSGVPEFRIANILFDGSVLEAARKDAFDLVARDPRLGLSEHRTLAGHLRTFHQETMALLEVG